MLGFALLCIGIEALLQLSDRGVILPAGLRGLAYDLGAFWPGLLRGWRPRYPAQPWLMFLTYGVLHAGLLHLLCNMTALWSLAPQVAARVGVGRLALLWLLAQAGGGLAYLALSGSARPMVGASGGLFGLAGALLVDLARQRLARRPPRGQWRGQHRGQRRGAGLGPIWAFLLALAVLNVLSARVLGGLAWQAHLGGFVAGAAGMALIPRLSPRRGD